MRASLPLLKSTDFPALRRGELDTLQINVGYLCNQSCTHCHVNAGPTRKEQMSADTASVIVEFMRESSVRTLDITGGAPELNGQFTRLVEAARTLGLEVIDRCNLTVLNEPGYEHLGAFLADHQVRVVASLPCYLEDNVDYQRGKGVFASSIEALRKLNALGYGRDGSELTLDLVYNPRGPVLPPPQQALQADYTRELRNRYGIEFNSLLTLANLPVGRFGSVLQSKGQFHSYLSLLKQAHRDENLAAVMCRSLISVDWQGYVYDCDFNQMLDLPLGAEGEPRKHLSQLIGVTLSGRQIRVRDHCYGCTAGQGSSCGGALEGGSEPLLHHAGS
ncbi:MAG: arsenosugar biosynthesis radical SAM (seleno)protein ArsS [Pseudomonadota bacterium]